MDALRVQVRKDGSVTLPAEVLAALDAGPGSYLKFTVEKGRVEMVKVQYDPWTEGQKKKGPESFDDILDRQRQGLKDAERDFLEKLKKPPEIKPEDRPEFWD